LREQQDVETHIEEVLFDKLHETAYQLSPLGMTILGPSNNIKKLTRKQMIDYRDAWYTAPRMVLVGVGDINHDDFVALAKKYFSAVPSTPKKSELFSTAIEPTKYLGSEVRVYDSNIPLLYQAIAFQGPSLSSPDILPVNIIQILLGSWDKAMGAGKHIGSPLCQFVAEHGLARSVSSFNHAYSDTGLFGVQTVSVGSEEGTESLNVEVMSHLTRLCYKVKEEDLIRAKNILKNQILSQYEGRLDNICEEMGKQMLFYGRRPSLGEMFARIDLITTEQVQAVAQKYIYDQDPVSACVGDSFWAVDYNWLRIFTYYWRK
jgi:processing peptidase subunit beta